MIQSDRYLTDKEKRAIEFPLQLNDTSAAEYTALKEQYPDALIGFEAGLGNASHTELKYSMAKDTSQIDL